MIFLIILACVGVILAVSLAIASFYLTVIKCKGDNNLVNLSAAIASLSAMLAAIAAYFK